MFRLICVCYYCGGLFWDKFYAYRLVDNNEEYDRNIQMGERYLSPVLEIMNGFVLFLFIGLIAFSTSLVGNKTTLFVLGIIIFYVVRNKDW